MRKALATLRGRKIGDFELQVAIHKPNSRTTCKIAPAVCSEPLHLREDLLLVRKVVEKFDQIRGVDSDLFPPLTDSENESIEQFEKRLLEAEALGLDEMFKAQEKKLETDENVQEEGEEISPSEQEAAGHEAAEETAPSQSEELSEQALSEVVEEVNKGILYLRSVHLFCFYCASSYDDEEEMMKKCGERHYRSETSQNLTDNQKRWVVLYRKRVLSTIKTPDILKEEVTGKRKIQEELDKFHKRNSQVLEDGKTRCTICPKKLFKAFEFVVKHHCLKHADKVQEVKLKAMEDQMYQNYLNDDTKVVTGTPPSAPSTANALPLPRPPFTLPVMPLPPPPFLPSRLPPPPGFRSLWPEEGQAFPTPPGMGRRPPGSGRFSAFPPGPSPFRRGGARNRRGGRGYGDGLQPPSGARLDPRAASLPRYVDLDAPSGNAPMEIDYRRAVDYSDV